MSKRSWNVYMWNKSRVSWELTYETSKTTKVGDCVIDTGSVGLTFSSSAYHHSLTPSCSITHSRWDVICWKDRFSGDIHTGSESFCTGAMCTKEKRRLTSIKTGLFIMCIQSIVETRYHGKWRLQWQLRGIIDRSSYVPTVNYDSYTDFRPSRLAEKQLTLSRKLLFTPRFLMDIATICSLSGTLMQDWRHDDLEVTVDNIFRHTFRCPGFINYYNW